MKVAVTQILRPVKLAFLIKPNSKSSYIRAVELCSAFWGGKHFPILPLYKKFTNDYRKEYQLLLSPKEFYHNIFQNFNPDFIVKDDGLDQEYFDQIRGDRIGISINELEESISINEPKYGISILEILQHLKENDFAFQRTDSRKICCPKIGERDLFTATVCGRISNANHKLIKDLGFPSNYIAFPRINKSNLNQCLKESVTNYLDLTVDRLDIAGNPLWTSEFAVYLLQANSLNDLINCWNLRALGWNIVAIPIDEIDNPIYHDFLKEQQKEFNQFKRLINRINVIVRPADNHEIVFGYVHKIQALQADPQKKVEYSFHHWLPRFWGGVAYLSSDRAASVMIRSDFRKTDKVITEDLKIKVSVLRPAYKVKYLRHNAPRYVNQVILDFDEIEGKYAQTLPEMPSKDLDFIIRGSGFSQWRFSNGNMYYLAQETDEDLTLDIPNAKEVFEKWFAVRNLGIRNSPAGKLANQFLKNIGGAYGTNFFTTRGIPPILALFENGRTVLKQELDAELNKQLIYFREKDVGILIARLLQSKIIEFGAEIQCNFCNQRSFYKLDQLEEQLKCPVCHNSFLAPTHRPKEIKWAYRGMGPFSKTNKADGILTVLLVLRFFKISLSLSYITPLMSFEILSKNQVINEVDFGVFHSKFKGGFKPPDLFLCECKSENEFLQKDIEKMKKLGMLFPGCVLTFATLKLQLSDDEKALIVKLANFFRKGISSRPTNPILILTGNELLPKTVFKVFENIEGGIIPHLDFDDEIGHLADVTCQRYLGLTSFHNITGERLEVLRKKYGMRTQERNNIILNILDALLTRAKALAKDKI